MDPQQRKLLEVGYAALVDAGLAKPELLGSAAGVFVGIQVGEYGSLPHRGQPSPYSATGASAAIAANRVSYLLGLEGLSMSVDTACSSALVALETGRQCLGSGLCETALVGTVNVLVSVAGFIGTCSAHMLSPTGRCRTFDAAADGYARAEGWCAVVIQPCTTEAVHLVAVMINQDGRTANLTSTNGPACTRPCSCGRKGLDSRLCCR